jgi:hypothetical protein
MPELPTLSEMMAEIEDLERQAQPGPWEWVCDFGIGDAMHWNVHRVQQPDRTVCLGLVSMANESWSVGRYPTAEMKLLTAARNAAPALIAEIRRLREELKRDE